MAKNSIEKEPEQTEGPKTKSIELQFEFSDDPYDEGAFGIHSIIRQLNEFKQTLLEFDYRGWQAQAIDHYFKVDFVEAEVSPETWDKVLGISKRRCRHPYMYSDTPTLHEALQRIKANKDKEE